MHALILSAVALPPVWAVVSFRLSSSRSRLTGPVANWPLADDQRHYYPLTLGLILRSRSSCSTPGPRSFVRIRCASSVGSQRLNCLARVSQACISRGCCGLWLKPASPETLLSIDHPSLQGLSQGRADGRSSSDQHLWSILCVRNKIELTLLLELCLHILQVVHSSSSKLSILSILNVRFLAYVLAARRYHCWMGALG